MRTEECTLQKQPSARPVYPSAFKPRSTCSSSRAYHPHACCACPSAAPGCAREAAVGPLSSESTMPTLLRLRRRLTSAHSVTAPLVSDKPPP